MTIIKIDEKARKFIVGYDKLCKKYNMQIQFADETGYFVEVDPFNSDIDCQVAGLFHDFAVGVKDE